MHSRHTQRPRFAPALLMFLLSAGATGIAFATIPPEPIRANAQEDGPAFGIVSITPDQSIRLNVVCWAHDVLDSPPDPCAGDLMFHDMAGNIVARQPVRLAPGQAASLDFSYGARVGGLSGIDPCWIPDPTSGRALPTVEVFDTFSGKVAQHVNPVTPRISLIANGARGR